MRALLLLCVFFGGAASAAQAAPAIQVRARAEVDGPVVRLADVAKLSGFAEDARARFASIELGRAPAPGVGQLLPEAYVVGKLRDAGVGPGVRLDVPRRVEITRKGRTIRGDALAKQVRDAVRQAMPHDPRDVAELSVPRLSDLTIPAGSRLDIRFAAGERFVGPTVAEIVVADHGETVRAQKVTVRVDPFVRAWGVREELPRDHRLSPADLVALRLPGASVPRDAITDPQHVDGAKVRRPIKPGEPIRGAWVEVPPLVKRGDRVRMIARRGGLEITASGEALDAAGRGESVRVKNPSSMKIVSGRVIGPGTVEMEL